MAKAGQCLCCFFGDNEFQWLKPGCIVSFEAAKEEKLIQKGAKAHKVGQCHALALHMHEGRRHMQALHSLYQGTCYLSMPD